MSNNIPDVTNTNSSMGVFGSFSASIKKGDESGLSVVKEKIAGIEEQENRIVEKYIKHDEKKEEDLALGKKGKVVEKEWVQGWDADFPAVMETTVDFDTKTKKPKEMHTKTKGDPNVNVQSDVVWGKDGHIDLLKERRVSDSGTETVTFRHDHKKGVIFYEEKFEPKA